MAQLDSLHLHFKYYSLRATKNYDQLNCLLCVKILFIIKYPPKPNTKYMNDIE